MQTQIVNICSGLTFFRKQIVTSSTHRWFKLGLTLTAIAPFFLAFLSHPASKSSHTEGADLDGMAWGAVGQWVCVLSLLLYFASYYEQFSPISGSAVRSDSARRTRTAEEIQNSNDTSPLVSKNT